MRDPVRRKLDEHAERHVPATTDLWPALHQRLTGRAGWRGQRRVWQRALTGAGAASTVVLALAVLVLAGVLLSPGAARRGSTDEPVAATTLALPNAACPMSDVATPVACRLVGGAGLGSAATPSATPATTGAACDNAAVIALVARFLDAYNVGDQARLLAFFPVRDATRGHLVRGEETYFQRYWDVRKPTLRDEDGFAAYARDELPPYWAQRHAQHERLQLRQIDGGGENSFGLVGFGFLLTRQADDLPTHAVYGKAEIDCAQGTFTVWSMGPQEQPATPTPGYSIPITPDPRYRALDLPVVTPGTAPGIPAITPSNPTAAAGLPTFTEQEVRAVALTAGHWPDELRPVGATTIVSVEFLSHTAVEPRVGGHLNPTPHDELCLVKLAGGFTRAAPDGGGTGPMSEPVTSQHLYLLFDARTGNFLMLYQPSPNMDQ